MKPVYREDIPVGEEWLYEVKYDGFRAQLKMTDKGDISLTSKNKQALTSKFPEIVQEMKKHLPSLKKFLPLILDGELVVLNNRYQANFSEIQKRGRMSNRDNINKAAQKRTANLMIFDVLEANGKDYTKSSLITRKKVMEEIIQNNTFSQLQPVDVFEDLEDIKEIIFTYKAEGIVAKRRKSRYEHGKNHQHWLKIKNWRTVHGFLTSYDSENGYFDVAVYKNKEIISIGKCKHGLDTETFNTLKQFFIQNGRKHENRFTVPPAIVAQINTLDLYKNELREPVFSKLAPAFKPENCTYHQLKLDLAMFPKEVELTNTDKSLWKEVSVTKGDLLTYIREVAPYMLPFLKNRLLTVIRAPDGINADFFFQKHVPSYAPEFVTVVENGEEKFSSCNNLESLIWFANQGSIEYHVPFEYVNQAVPLEIVFDLDPPDRSYFHLAVSAAQLIKNILDELSLQSFVKTSGNKGLQIHIPIREGSMTYEETALFTQSIAYTLENTYPAKFTTERMKAKRGKRLYIDYVQHGKEKTIIAPYSPRKTKDATIATPLYWEELNEQLDPSQFTITTVPDRIKEKGCPFAGFNEAGLKQQLNKVLTLIRTNKEAN
jgi:bifunctional non-homologous end joining protein LigD